MEDTGAKTKEAGMGKPSLISDWSGEGAWTRGFVLPYYAGRCRVDGQAARR
jgi:hypothetical protein